MSNDRAILTAVLTQAIEAFRRMMEESDAKTRKEGRPVSTVLTAPRPDSSILDPIASAIEQCDAFGPVAGHIVFSANSGIPLHGSSLADILFYRSQHDVDEAVSWLLRLLGTTRARGFFRAAIWGLTVDREIPLTATTRLIPFSQFPRSKVGEALTKRARPLWDKSEWWSQTIFSTPRAGFIADVQEFPYICTDDTSFKEMQRIERDAKELWTLIEACAVGRPLAFAYWFEYDDPELDIDAWSNSATWSLPEVAPHIRDTASRDAAEITTTIQHYAALPIDLRTSLLRSMERFTLSQCRRQLVDRILDLTLAFEIATSGGEGNAPMSWKVSVRSAQLIGGSLERRQDNRRKINELYRLRNKSTHGSSLDNEDQEKAKEALQQATSLYPVLALSLLRLGEKPNWNSLELQPAFND